MHVVDQRTPGSISITGLLAIIGALYILKPFLRMIRQMTIELKVKAKSLADEARTIRAEEQKAKAKGCTSILNSLHSHRIHVVRPEARATHLTRAFLRNMPYNRVEAPGSSYPPVDSIVRMLQKYGGEEGLTKAEIADAVNLWVDGNWPTQKKAA